LSSGQQALGEVDHCWHQDGPDAPFEASDQDGNSRGAASDLAFVEHKDWVVREVRLSLVMTWFIGVE